MIESSGQGGHSAQVKMRLLLNGSSIPVMQMGSDFLIVQSAMEHPPTDATLEICIDASERRWTVRLPHGMSAASQAVTISRVILGSAALNVTRLLTPNVKRTDGETRSSNGQNVESCGTSHPHPQHMEGRRVGNRKHQPVCDTARSTQ